MKVGVLGSGTVAQTLAAGLVKYGYEVTVGTRNPEKLNDWKQALGNKVRVATFEEAAKFGKIIILAVKGVAAESALQLAGNLNLAGKTVIDATNPIKEAPPVNGVLQFFTSLDNSLLEILQAKYPDANFVKAFSSVGAAFMVDPDFEGIKPTMFIAGNSVPAKAEVKRILDLFGWETEDMGTAEAARAIEPLCMLWCIPGFRENKWAHAFKLLKK